MKPNKIEVTKFNIAKKYAKVTKTKKLYIT